VKPQEGKKQYVSSFDDAAYGLATSAGWSESKKKYDRCYRLGLVISSCGALVSF